MEIIQDIDKKVYNKIDVYDFDIYTDPNWLTRIKPKIIWSGDPITLDKVKADIFSRHSLLDLSVQDIRDKIQEIIEWKMSNELFYDWQNARLEEIRFDTDWFLNIWLSSFRYSKNLSHWASYNIISDILSSESDSNNKISWWISINVLPKTSDGKFVYWKKKVNDYIWWIIEYPKSFNFPKKTKTDEIDIDYKDYPIWYTVKKETWEELGVPAHLIEDIKIHWLLLWWLGRFVFLTTINLQADSDQVKQYFQKLSHKEHEDILFFDNLEDFCENVSQQSEVKKLWTQILLQNKNYIQ